MAISYISHRDFINGHSSYWWTKVAESHLEKLQMILSAYTIYIIVYIPPDNRTDCSNRDMMTTAKHNRRIKLLGDNKPRANIRVNGEWQYRSEGLSCQSEVIGLLIVLQNKRRLL